MAEAAARRAAVLAQIRAEDQRLKLVLGIAGAAVCAAAIVFITAPFGPRVAVPAVEAKAQPLMAEPPLALVQTAAATPPPASPPPPVQTATAKPAPSPPPVSAPVSTSVSPPSAPSAAPLVRDDIREIQARLVSLGFNAGPADGNAGRVTSGAIMNYQQQRGLPQTGKPDRALLDQLRDDPASKTAAAQAAPLSQQSDANREALAQAAARNRALEEQLLARWDTAPNGGQQAPDAPLEKPVPKPGAPATDKPGASSAVTNDKPVAPPSEKLMPKPTTSSDKELVRLMARARRYSNRET